MKVISLLVVIGVFAAVLAGCGGGGGAGSVTGLLAGTVYAPETGRSRQAISGQTKLAGATVQMISLADGSVLDTTTTDSNGYYRFARVRLGINVRVRVVKTEDSGAITVVEAVVSVTSAVEINKDIDAVTTVAAQALQTALANVSTAKNDTAVVEQMIGTLEQEVRDTYTEATLPTMTGSSEAAVDAANQAAGQTIVDAMPKITVTAVEQGNVTNSLQASIYLNGVDTGQKTPLAAFPVSKGVTSIAVKLNGYRDGSDTRDVQADAAFDFQLVKQPKPKLTSASVGPTTLTFHGGDVALEAKTNDNTVTSVEVQISKGGSTATASAPVTLTADGNKGFSGTYTAEGNGKTRTDYYTVVFVAKDGDGVVQDEVVSTFQVSGVPTPPGKPGF